MPRIRKAVDTSAEVKSGAKRRRSLPRLSPRRPLTALVKKPVFKPLAALARPVSKVFAWLTPSYFINSWREVRQVTWPNWRETRRLTFAVFIFAAIFGGLVAVVDKGLDKIFKELILR